MKRWWLPILVTIFLVVLAGVAAEQDQEEFILAEGCADHELLRFITCHTRKPIYVVIGSLGAFGQPDALAEQDEFRGCTGVALVNGTTVAVRGSVDTVKSYWQRERSKHRLCRRWLDQKARELELEPPQ